MLLGAIAPRWNDSAGMAELVAALERYSWPGNVRELQSVLFQARMAAGDRAWVTAEEVIKVIEAQLPASTEEPAKSLGESRPLPDDAKSLPKKPRPPLNEEHLRALLEQQGSATAVARSLGVARVTVYRWMRKFGLS